jgi:hypothetical protein
VSGAPVRVSSGRRMFCTFHAHYKTFYDHISPGQELQTHIQTDGNIIRLQTAQTHNEHTSTECNLVIAQSTAYEPPEMVVNMDGNM